MDTKLPTTPRVNKAIAIAAKIAADNGHTYIGTEHLFLALIDDDQPAVDRILTACGISSKDLRGRATSAFKAYSGTEKPKPDMAQIAESLRRLADIIG